MRAQRWCRYKYMIVTLSQPTVWPGHSSPTHLRTLRLRLTRGHKMKITTRPFFIWFVIVLNTIRMTHCYNYSIRIGMENAGSLYSLDYDLENINKLIK